MQQGILTKKQILELLDEGKISFSPQIDSFQLQAHSVDLRLGYSFMIPKLWKMTDNGREAFLIDYVDSKDRFELIELEHKQFFDLLPKEYVIATTLEEVKISDDLMAVLYPRSSINRRGLSVDLSGIVDAGYEGRLLIPITNNTQTHVIRLYPGERFCQLVFYSLSEPVKIVESRWHKKDIIIGKLPERKRAEEKLIQSGDIKTLKQKFALNKS